MRRNATTVVQALFLIFMDDPSMLPDEWREAARSAATESLRARVIADYIAGMTDRFALEEHRVLTDPFTRA
jgi:dGTPase